MHVGVDNMSKRSSPIQLFSGVLAMELGCLLDSDNCFMLIVYNSALTLSLANCFAFAADESSA